MNDAYFALRHSSKFAIGAWVVYSPCNPEQLCCFSRSKSHSDAGPSNAVIYSHNEKSLWSSIWEIQLPEINRYWYQIEKLHFEISHLHHPRNLRTRLRPQSLDPPQTR